MRFLISEGFPSSQIRVEWAGASEPAISGSYGLAAARNRRVEVLRFVPAVEEEMPPIGANPLPAEPEPTPGFRIPKAALPSSLTIDIPLDIKLPTIATAEVIISGSVGGVLKLKVNDKSGGWGGGLAIKNGKLSAKFESKITEDLKGKISFEPASVGNSAVLKVGGEMATGQMDTSIGLQTKLPNFVYCEFSFIAIPLPDVVLGNAHVTMILKPTLKIDAAPGPAMLMRLGVTAGTAGVVIAGTAAASAMLIIATAKVVEDAKKQSILYTSLLARRAGVAARAAYEIVGTSAEVDFRQERLNWVHTLDQMGPSFDEGVELVNKKLRSGNRDKLRAEWTTKYAQSSQIFTDIQPRIFQAIGNLDKADSNEIRGHGCKQDRSTIKSETW